MQTTRCEEILGILLFVGDWASFLAPSPDWSRSY
jgi:hypothetical protein